MNPTSALTLHSADYLILALYLAFVLGIGVVLRARVKTSSEFLTSGRAVPLWITSLAFISANLGAQELIGMSASGAKYGMMTAHFYWGGTIPAMLFAGVFMMPYYYMSRARSVPEYLRLRFDEKTRAFNALSFAAMTIFSSGISMHALGLLLQLVLGWSYTASVLLSTSIVLAYTFAGGLTSAMYNEVLQFFLIILGFAPLAILALLKSGGWQGIAARVPEGMMHVWRNTPHPSANPMGVDLFGLVAGLGFVLAFGYWCTDFLVLQRAMAADSVNSARLTPLVAAFPKMIMPFIVVLPGVAALAVSATHSGYSLPVRNGAYDYDQVLMTLMGHFYPPGLLGVGVTALMASFMSGTAGNITAFNTVWTYDIYQSYLRPHASDQHYLLVARLATVVGAALSVATAFLAQSYNNLMDFLQLVFGFVNAPLFATFLLGMFWRRTTGHGAFVGLVAGTSAAALAHGLTTAEGKGGWLARLHQFPSTMAQNFWIAFAAWLACFLCTVVVSVATHPKSEGELTNLVYGLAKLGPARGAWYRRPALLALIAGAVWLALNLLFW